MKMLSLIVCVFAAIVGLSYVPVESEGGSVYRSRSRGSCSGMSASREFSRTRSKASCSNGFSRSRARTSCSGGF